MTCPDCDGNGFVLREYHLRGDDVSDEKSCDTCEGSGELEEDADRQIDALDMIGLDAWGHER